MLPWIKEIDTAIHTAFFTLREAFLAFDSDKAGELTESKFLEGVLSTRLVSKEVPLSEDQIRAVFAALDSESRGKVNFEQFCHLSQKKRLPAFESSKNSPARISALR